MYVVTAALGIIAVVLIHKHHMRTTAPLAVPPAPGIRSTPMELIPRPRAVQQTAVEVASDAAKKPDQSQKGAEVCGTMAFKYSLESTSQTGSVDYEA